MDFTIHNDTISMKLLILCFKGSLRGRFLNYEVMSMVVVLILANSVDPDEMQHYAAFHLSLHCLH